METSSNPPIEEEWDSEGSDAPPVGNDQSENTLKGKNTWRKRYKPDKMRENIREGTQPDRIGDHEVKTSYSLSSAGNRRLVRRELDSLISHYCAHKGMIDTGTPIHTACKCAYACTYCTRNYMQE
jgi:hypothetical protein